MNSLFHPDSLIMRGLSKLADLIVLNILYIICCIPVITIGTSTTALNDAVTRLFRGEGNIFRAYFKALRANFKQATLQWIILLLTGTPLVMCVHFYSNVTTEIGHSLLWVTLLLACFWCSVCSWIFLLQARFYNSVRNSFRNAILCSIAYLPQTIAMITLDILPVALALLAPKLFIFGSMIFPLIWFSLIVSIKLKITKKSLQLLLERMDSSTTAANHSEN